MKWNWAVFLSFLLSTGYAQTIKGYLRNTLGNPISGIILIKDVKDRDLVRQFYQVEDGGRIDFSLDAFSPKVCFEARAMGYTVYEDSLNNILPNKEYFLEIKLKPEPIELGEIKITAVRSVVVKKDTVEYYPKAFLNGTERKLEDLLKRLPGLQVSDNGRLKYLGKTVEAVHLDGDDILGDKYTIGTKNISVDLVEKVQAIDNFVSNPLLKGVVSSETVALNIVLKKTKTKYNGEANIGLGIGKQGLMRDASLDILSLNHRLKTYSNIRHNNIGENAYNIEYSSVKAEDFLSNEITPMFAQKIIGDKVPESLINHKNTRINNETSSSINFLTRLNKKLLSKVNAYFFNDELSSTESSQVSFLHNNQGFDDSHSTKYTPKRGQLLSKLEYTINANNLINFEISFRKENDFQNIELLQNRTNFFQNTLKSDARFFLNKFDFTHKISSNKILQFKSLTGKSFIDQVFSINADSIFIGNKQNMGNDLLDFQNQLYYFQKNVNTRITAVLGQQTNQVNFSSTLLKNNENIFDFDNHFYYEFHSYYAKIKWEIEKNGFLFTPEMRLITFDNTLLEEGNKLSVKNAKVVFEPSFQMTYKPIPTNLITVSADLKYKPTAFENLFSRGILEENRVIKKNELNLDFQKTQQATVGYRFHEPFTFFAINVSAYWKQDYNVWINDISYDNNFITFVSFRKPKTFRTIGLIFGIDKLIPAIKTSFKYSGQIGDFRYMNTVNHSEIRNNRSLYQTHTFFLKTGFSLPFGFENTSNVGKYNFKTNQQDNTDVVSLDNSLKVFYKLKDLTFMFTHKYINPQYNQKKTFQFLDFEIDYKRSKSSRIYEYRLIGNNLLGTNFIKSWSNSDFAVTTSQSRLLGRYVLLSLSIRL